MDQTNKRLNDKFFGKKPHISWTPGGLVFRGTWACMALGHLGFGVLPSDAFRAWELSSREGRIVIKDWMPG